MKTKIIWILLSFIVVIGLPFLFQKDFIPVPTDADRRLVIISPHTEAIRFEFTHAFTKYWKEKTGETVAIDWRTPGGTSEIARFISSEFLGAFQHYWTSTLKQKWNSTVQSAFDNPRVTLPSAEEIAGPHAASLEQQARQAFLDSSVGIGIDLFFGGGSYDFIQQANAGRLVDSGILQRHPEWFSENGIPQALSGEPYYDAEGRWVGACLSAFGICYNSDILPRFGLTSPPRAWRDLANPVLQDQVALADPTKSGSAAKVFEMLIQQQIQEVMSELPPDASPEQQTAALHQGWDRAFQLLISISANTRYFTDSASRIPIDVALGDAVAGMCIDFYGRFESEAVQKPDGSSRMHYLTPPGGSSVGSDPIALLRGAPEPELAQAFIDFVLSPEGQKLWNYKPGTPGGPVRFALRRLPIQPELYLEQHLPFRSDPQVNAYAEAQLFHYTPEWTARLFNTIRFLVKVTCIDPHPELKSAWITIQNSPNKEAALKKLLDVSALSYSRVTGEITQALRSSSPLEQAELTRNLTIHFQQQYQQAATIAKSSPSSISAKQDNPGSGQ